MTKPRLGIPYHPKYTNLAFWKTVTSLEDYFEIKLLDCRESKNTGLVECTKKNTEQIDGLLLPGGHYDHDFKLFGSSRQDNQCDYQFKMSMLQHALKRGMPVLSLCAGMVLMNHALGGGMRFLSKNKGDIKVNHVVDPLQGKLAHPITVASGTHLHDILIGKKAANNNLTLTVNSWHDASITNKVAKGLTVSALAPDGVVEAVEMPHPNNPNCWGLQFHPEYVDPQKTPEEYEQQSKIVRAFKQSCLQFKLKRAVNQEIDMQMPENSQKIYSRL